MPGVETASSPRSTRSRGRTAAAPRPFSRRAPTRRPLAASSTCLRASTLPPRRARARPASSSRRALSPDDPTAPLPPVPKPYETSERHASQLAALVRIMQGLPPLEAIPGLTVGMEEVDGRIAQLFETASNDGSVFAVLLGEYGAGKTHHLLHLEARALAEGRPVLRLAVERLDEDLGNPQRHLRRLIESATFPGKRPVGFLERLDGWLAKPAARKRLRQALDAVFEARDETARPAARAIAGAPDDEVDDDAVREIFGALDLVDKPSSPSYRKDAYARLHLWLDVLERLEGCAGPVLILDEAENLYRVGVSRAERRTALRSLAHYCGGGRTPAHRPPPRPPPPRASRPGGGGAR